MNFVWIGWLSLMISSVSFANGSYVLCKNKATVRTIRVIENEKGESCSTTYTKGGKDQVIGSARNSSSCLGFLKNVRTNLEEASWKCRDISHAKIVVSESSQVN